MNNSLMARLYVVKTRNQFINSLEDGTVFSIIESLRDLQELREKFVYLLFYLINYYKGRSFIQVQ